MGTLGVGGPRAAAETLDEVVASIENVALTQSDVERAYRLERLLNGQKPEGRPDAATFEQVLDRLVDQKLLIVEAEAEGLKAADFAAPAAQMLEEVRKHFANEEEFASAIRSLGMSEAQVLEHLEEAQRVLHVIDVRLRPAAWVEASDIEAYYRDTFVPEQSRRGVEPPPLAEVEEKLREILLQGKIDDLLKTWLGELKSSRRVRMLIRTAASAPRQGDGA